MSAHDGVGAMEMRRRSHSALGPSEAPAADKTASHQPRAAVSSFKAYFSITAIALIFLVVVLVAYLNYGFQSFRDPSLGADEASSEYRRPLDLILKPQDHRSRAPKLVYQNWTVTSAVRRPDGVAKRVYLINGQFPGPTLESRSGDTFIIRVENALEDEGVSIHWHGLHMRDHIEYDGAIGMTQCPIPPGSTFTYTIPTGIQHGTFWYHAHEQVQRADGLYGALVVHEPVVEENVVSQDNYEDRVLMIGDWYHRPAEEVLKWYMRAGTNTPPRTTTK
jgi:FtsP/CotA-like multicopper oxidase with cupredoxin domain